MLDVLDAVPLALAGTSFALGARHGLDWDHIAAITDLTAPRAGTSSARAATAAAAWACRSGTAPATAWCSPSSARWCSLLGIGLPAGHGRRLRVRRRPDAGRPSAPSCSTSSAATAATTATPAASAWSSARCAAAGPAPAAARCPSTPSDVDRRGRSSSACCTAPAPRPRRRSRCSPRRVRPGRRPRRPSSWAPSSPAWSSPTSASRRPGCRAGRQRARPAGADQPRRGHRAGLAGAGRAHPDRLQQRGPAARRVLGTSAPPGVAGAPVLCALRLVGFRGAPGRAAGEGVRVPRTLIPPGRPTRRCAAVLLRQETAECVDVLSVAGPVLAQDGAAAGLGRGAGVRPARPRAVVLDLGEVDSLAPTRPRRCAG